MRAEEIVERGGDGYGVAIRIDDGEVRGVGRVLALAGAGGRWRQKSFGAMEGRAGRGGVRIDAGTPGIGVFLRGHLGHGDVVEVGIAEVVGAVHVSALMMV